MDALSLSHLTYCCATLTINFHRLDHPPFPCKSRLRQIRIVDKSCRRTVAVHPALPLRHHIAGCACILRGKTLTHEATDYHRNSSHRRWHHRIRNRRNLLHSPEESCRPWLGPNLAQNSGHSSPLADFQHYFSDCRAWFGNRWNEVKVIVLRDRSCSVNLQV